MREIDSTWYKRPPGMPEHDSAGGVVVRLEADRVLLAFITEKGDGRYVLPKGHVEPGESTEGAAVREIAEEAGFHRLQLVASLGAKERLSYDKSSWKRTTYFLFSTEEVEGHPTDHAVTGETVWFPFDALPPLFWPEQAALIEEHHEQIERWARDQRAPAET